MCTWCDALACELQYRHCIHRDGTFSLSFSESLWRISLVSNYVPSEQFNSPITVAFFVHVWPIVWQRGHSSEVIAGRKPLGGTQWADRAPWMLFKLLQKHVTEKASICLFISASSHHKQIIFRYKRLKNCCSTYNCWQYSCLKKEKKKLLTQNRGYVGTWEFQSLVEKSRFGISFLHLQ